MVELSWSNSSLCQINAVGFVLMRRDDVAPPLKIVGNRAKKRGPQVKVEPRALPVLAFARAYGFSPVTVWRACKDGRLKYVMVGNRKRILLPSVETPESAT
jgi:hypothetical protein